MKSAHVLIEAGMMSAKEWISISIDIEQFRQAEGGSLDSAGDILAKWLTEDEKPKKGKKKSEVTQ